MPKNKTMVSKVAAFRAWLFEQVNDEGTGEK
jgi:hypothetical protein